jgi:hypothetical protein
MTIKLSSAVIDGVGDLKQQQFCMTRKNYLTDLRSDHASIAVCFIKLIWGLRSWQLLLNRPKSDSMNQEKREALDEYLDKNQGNQSGN